MRDLAETLSAVAILSLDAAGQIQSANAAARRLFGIQGDEGEGMEWSRLYRTEEIAAGMPQRELEQAVKEGCFESVGWRVRTDGTLFWAESLINTLRDATSGDVQGFGIVMRDLTKRRMAATQLEAIEAEFRLLVERVEEYAIFMLDPTGHVMTWNAGAEKIKGYTRSDIIGKSFEIFYTPEERVQGKPARLLKLAETEGHIRDQGPRVRKDGTHFEADVLITAVRDETGRLHGFGKVSRDLADLLRTRGLEAEKAAVEMASKMKDDFLAVLSHELRTPLTPVLAAASYLVENVGQLPEEMQEIVGTLHRNVRLEAQLIDDLLDLTRIERGKIELRLEAVDVHAALKDVLKICDRDRTNKRIELETAFDAQGHWIWADPTRIRQVFWNLLNNAVKFTPESGRISVRTSNSPQHEMLIEVSDTGIGIEASQLHRIFNAFEQGERTVTRRFGGLGLGLAITRSLVEMQGGKITAKSEGQNRGATFALSFNTAPEAPHVSRPPAGKVSAPQTLRILLVDDHDDTRRLLSRLLLQRGHKVSTASTMHDALKLIEEPHDVLISDIGLPDGSGLELMQAARHRGDIRGIALSGFGMPEDLERSARAGFEHHLVKPLDVQSLHEILKDMSRSASR